MDTRLSSPLLRHEPRSLTLTPDLSFREAGREVLGFYFDQLLANQADSVNYDSARTLHDLRVATRRLRAALRDFRSAFDRGRVRQLEQDAQWLGTLVGRIRDLDVFLDWLRNYAATAPESRRPLVRRVIKERETMRARQRAAFLAGLHSPRYETFCANFQQLLADPHLAAEAGNRALGDDGSPAGDVRERARQKIKRAWKRVRQRARKADARHPRRLHRLRIETKQLRYTAQFFRSLDPDGLKKMIDRAGRVQDALGGFHDAEMQIQFLRDMRRLQSSDAEMRAALKAMIAQRRSEQAAYYDDFRRAFRRLRSKKLAKELASATTDH